MITWVFVDVDGTLVDQKDNVRPDVEGLFRYLNRSGCVIVVWSAGGAGYAEQKIGMIGRKLNVDLNPMIGAYMWKADSRSVCAQSRFYIDDSEGLIEAMDLAGYGTFLVPFYDPSIENDEWLFEAAHAVEKFIDARIGEATPSDNGN